MTALIAVGQTLPHRSFAQVTARGTVSWNQGTMASVIFVPHRGACPDCAGYAARLATAVPGLREWATRALILMPDGDGAESVGAATDQSGTILLADEGGAGRDQLGVGDDQAAVIQLDRWGAAFEVEAIGRAGELHAGLPGPEDLVALAQFIDIQCPECGVPSKEWLSASPFPLG